MDNKKSIDQTNYLLDKSIWEKYDMIETKDNVKLFLAEYKKSISLSINLSSVGTQGITANYGFDNIFSKVRNNNGGFSNRSDIKMDAQRLVDQIAPIITNVKSTFTEKEKIYFDYCLAENNSDNSVAKLLDKCSKTGVKPVSYSCILKIAFAFGLEVIKK